MQNFLNLVSTKQDSLALFKEIGICRRTWLMEKKHHEVFKEYFGNNPEFVDEMVFVTTLKYSAEKLKQDSAQDSVQESA